MRQPEYISSHLRLTNISDLKMSSIKEYFSSVGKGIKSLVQGMEVTGKEFVTPKITEQYPENRATLEIPERFRAELTLKYDAEGRHKCIACGICR